MSPAYYTKFDTIYDQYKNWVYVSTKKLIPQDEEHRQDVEQLVWMRVWKYIDTINLQYKLTPLLLLMTRQVCFTEQKKQNTKKNRFSKLDTHAYDVYYDSREDMEMILEFHRLLSVINTKIKVKFRQAALLKWIYGYSEKDLVRELNLPYPKVKSILAMAKKDIVKHYKN